MKVAVTGGTGSWDRGLGPVVIAALEAQGHEVTNLDRAVPGGIGPPGFSVTIEKNKAGPAGRTHLLHWNSHERSFYAEQPGRRHRDRPVRAAAAGTVVRFRGGGTAHPGPAHSGPTDSGIELSLSFDGPDRAGTPRQDVAADSG